MTTDCILVFVSLGQHTAGAPSVLRKQQDPVTQVSAPLDDHLERSDCLLPCACM